MLPVLFTLPMPWGQVPFYSYGLLLGLSLFVGLQVVVRVGARYGELSESLLGNTTLIAACAGLVGARLLYVLENHEALEEQSASLFDLTLGGVTAYGGFLGGLLGASAYLAYKRASLLAFADAAAPALALGTLLTRIGSYLYGSDFGVPLAETAPSWLKTLGTFPRWHHEKIALHGSPALLHHIQRYGLSREASQSLPVHPTQLYEALVGLLLFGLACWLMRHRSFRGQVMLVVAMAYGSFRFLIEYLRDDPERGHAFGFSSGQLISLLLVPICAVVYTAQKSRLRRA